MTQFNYIVIGFKKNTILVDNKISKFCITLKEAKYAMRLHNKLYPKSDIYLTKIKESFEEN